MTTAPSSTAAANTTEAVLGGAALAVGVLLAGVAVGRRSRLGVIAGMGMAALAGYAILKRSRQQTVAAAPPAPKPVEAETLAETPAPVVAEVIAPVVASLALEAPKQLVEDYLPEAPLIWEAGDTGSRASEGLGETVWFGLQDVKLDEPAVAATANPPETHPIGEVALEADLAPLASVFLSDFPPAPEIESHGAAPAISPEVAALIQALNPPPLSPAMLDGPAFLLGSNAFAGEGSSSTEDYDDLSEAVGFLLEDEAPAKPLATIG